MAYKMKITDIKKHATKNYHNCYFCSVVYIVTTTKILQFATDTTRTNALTILY